jgi:hypothetical protein
MLTSRDRVRLALAHEEADLVPLDLGGSSSTGMLVNTVYMLRQALRLDPPGTPVKVVDTYHMLGEIAPDLQEVVGADIVELSIPGNRFGEESNGWKEWTAFDGTPTLVPSGFNTEPDANGDLLMYPGGEASGQPSARMPKGGWYFDAIERQLPIDDATLSPDDNLEEYKPISDVDLAYLGTAAERLSHTGRAVMGAFGCTSFGNVVRIVGMGLKEPKGIRSVEEWYISLSQRREFVYEMFDRQCHLALQNLERIHEVVGERVDMVFLTGTDFGAQNGPLVSPKMYRELFKPFHARLNDWVHAHTTWKTFMHSCGSIWRLLDDIVDAGFDVINPIQTSAAAMDPAAIKAKYGGRVTLCGGGIDTQHVLPFGTPDEVRTMVRERMQVFGPGGGYIFSTIHNVQAGVPIENVRALYEAANACRRYPLA